MKKVILDCDNTFGLANHDIDDGLTLLYLLGSPLVDLLGVTLTYGNGDLTEVTTATEEFHQKLKGKFTYYGTHQADFLVNQVNRYPEQVTILATGALTNLAQAQLMDPDFFKKVQEIVVMGGITKALVVNQHPVAELNFSCDPCATEMVLLGKENLTVMNGHLTSQAFFSKNDVQEFLLSASRFVTLDCLNWFEKTFDQWISWNETYFHFQGFCNWDMTTAVYLERPEFFSQEIVHLASQQFALAHGQISLEVDSEYTIKMPETLVNLSKFNQLVIARMLAGLKSEL